LGDSVNPVDTKAAYATAEKMLRTIPPPSKSAVPVEIDEEALLRSANKVASELLDESCEVDPVTSGPLDEDCADESKLSRLKSKLSGTIFRTVKVASGDDFTPDTTSDSSAEEDEESYGEMLERGWEKRGNASAIRRNAEIWRFALKAVFKVLKPRNMKKKGKASDEEIVAAKYAAANFIREGLLKLGPSFVKLGQVISTRTDVLAPEYIDVLKTLQDDVPQFSQQKAEQIICEEFGVKKVTDIFDEFGGCIAAASLGQVHTGVYKGKKVAIKVQRSGLKELFDVDLKNLRKLAALLDQFDPKSDGADRNWVDIYNESERLLYLEIQYTQEADNAERFARDFEEIDWVRVPKVYRSVTTDRVLTMEFVESLKLTDIEQIDKLGLDKELLAKRAADAFLRQIVEKGFFHCDPHPGNFCVDKNGGLVYYDFGMVDSLSPNVQAGFKKFCTALFAGGPKVADSVVAENAKLLVEGVEQAGVLSRKADRLAVEKLARYYMRTFKNTQLGIESGGIKETVGTDLQTLTDNNVFQFPPTFTFIFRAFASIDGIGKGLDENFSIGQLSQPFIEKFTESEKGYKSDFDKNFRIFSKATGLNAGDVETAVTSPRKIAYLEKTVRDIVDGNLKIRTRSLENEKSLERMTIVQDNINKLVLISVALQFAGGGLLGGSKIVRAVGWLLSAKWGVSVAQNNVSLIKFDKIQARFKGDKEKDFEK